MSGDKTPRAQSLNVALSARTPNIRQKESSRFARRSVVFSASNTSTYLGDSPSILQVKETPSVRTRIIQDKTISPLKTNRSALKTPGSSFKAVSFFNTSDRSFSDYDITGLPTPSRFNLNTPFKSQIRDSFNVSDITTLAEDDPGLTVTKSLYEEFMYLYQNHPSEQQVFELLKAYEKTCDELIPLLRQLLVKSSNTSSNRTAATLYLLTQERNTWRLARGLYEDRLIASMSLKEDGTMNLIGKRYSDKEIVDNLYKHDDSVRQTQIIVDWLEENMSDDLEKNFGGKMEYFSESHVAWENTLSHLENASSNNRTQYGVRQLVTEMDPDASYRQKLPIHDLDQEDENRLMKHVFVLIMSGKLDEAQKVSERHGFHWLGAIMEGWTPHHDPNFNATLHDGYQLLPIEGNLNRDIWKATCWQIIETQALAQYEKGIYAALSGHLKGLLSVCTTWDEYLWAYTRVFVDAKVEEEIRGATTQLHRPLVHLPPTSWSPPTSLEQVFQELEASSNQGVQDERSHYQRVVQKHIILNSIDDLLEVMNNWLNDTEDIPHHLYRFMAHFVLFSRLLGFSEKEEICLKILEAYVLVLIHEGLKPLVATYVATLPSNAQIILYAKFLEDIFEKEEQRMCLELAETAGLDVHLITKTVVENICGKQPPSPLDARSYSDPQLTIETTQFDLEKINSLDWLIFDESQRSEATIQANNLLRRFIACRKIDAAQKTLHKLPSDTVYIVTRHWKRITDSQELPAEEDNAIREYLCFQAYLQAMESFNDWFNHFHHAKPAEPERPDGSGQTVKFTDWVAYEISFKQYESDLDRWKQASESQTKNTVDRLYNVLLFPEGWMVDQRTEQVDENRQKQMDLLRKLCIPQITTLLQNVLYQTEQFKECVQLSDIIADEKYGLFKEFSKEELKEFLIKMRESSLQLLDRNLDPFGYELE